MDSSQAADLAIFLVCCALFLAYNLFYFTASAFTVPLLGKRYVVLYAVNRRSRASWVETLSQGLAAAAAWQAPGQGLSVLLPIMSSENRCSTIIYKQRC
jgi:hypothetical protein